MTETTGDKLSLSRQELLSLLNRYGPTGPDPVEPIIVSATDGAWVIADNGRRLLDFSQGGTLPLGYNHAFTRQPAGSCAVGPGFEWPERISLMRKLAEIAPGGMNRRVMLCDSGREALAGAVSLACRETGRTRVVYAAEMASSQPDLRDAAAVVVNPLDARLAEVSESCRAGGALLVDDETFIAPGIAGRMFAIEHSGVRPDVYVLGRGLAAGMPFGACVAGRSTLRWMRKGTGGSPAGCLAALQYIGLLEAGLLDAGRALGARLARGLARLSDKARSCRVVGTGLALGLRFQQTGQTAGFVGRCQQEGLILARMGDATAGIAPPLVACDSEVDCALAIMEKVLSDG